MQQRAIILWTQGSQNNGTRLSVNGNIVESNDPQYNNYYRELCNISGMSCVCKSTHGGQLYYSKSKNEAVYSVKSNYQERDELGRRIAFMCKIKGAQTIQEALSALIQESRAIGYTLCQEELDCFVKGFARAKGIKLTIVVILAVLAICSLYFLFCHINH